LVAVSTAGSTSRIFVVISVLVVFVVVVVAVEVKEQIPQAQVGGGTCGFRQIPREINKNTV
jgi:MFS superfamily sulfate permease-like transporter